MKDFEGVTIKAIPWKVRTLAQLKRDGKLHLPDLQRSFRWSPERVKALHDSLYRRYPVGALLLWKPSWIGEEAPFATRAWDVWISSKDTNRGEREPIQTVQPGAIFVLDGQQRLTSLFRVIFRSLGKNKSIPDPDLLISLSSEKDWIDNPFRIRSRALRPQMKDGLLVDAGVLFEGMRGGDDTKSVIKAISEWVKPDDSLFSEALNRANTIRNAILENEIIAYEIDADAGDENVIEIFARLNQQGISLRPSELAAARLTGELKDFRERAKKVLSHKDLEGFVGKDAYEDRIRTGGYVDTDLIIRATLYLSTSTIRYNDLAKRKSDGKYEYAKIAKSWDAGAGALRASVKMFREAGIPEGRWIPYRYLLLAPAIAHANRHNIADTKWVGWALAASLWGYHAGDAETKAQADAKSAAIGDIGTLIENVKKQAKRLESILPVEEDLTEGVVTEGGLILAMLLHFKHCNARSFPTSKYIHSDSESLDLHHLFPRAYINEFDDQENDYNSDRLGNLTLIFGSDNRSIGDREPTDYLATIPKETLEAHCIPDDATLWSIEKFNEFCEAREKLLYQVIARLMKGYGLN